MRERYYLVGSVWRLSDLAADLPCAGLATGNLTGHATFLFPRTIRPSTAKWPILEPPRTPLPASHTAREPFSSATRLFAFPPEGIALAFPAVPALG